LKNVLSDIGGFYWIVIAQLFGWLIAITFLTAGAAVLAGLFSQPTTVAEGLTVGSWVAVLAGGPVALAGAVVCLRRYAKRGAWPTFGRTARISVTGAWLIMAIILGLASDSVLSGIVWYGIIAVGIWGVAPWLFRIVPDGSKRPAA
jgi:hypothetical protein